LIIIDIPIWSYQFRIFLANYISAS